MIEGNTPKRVPVALTIAGAGRGATALLRPIAKFNSTSHFASIQPVFVDPAPAKALTLRSRARELGLEAEAEERTIEELLERRLENDQLAPILLAVDRPAGVASAIEAAVRQKRPLFAYQLLAVPSTTLYGVCLVLQAHETALKREVARFFRRLAEVTARSGATFVVGEQGRREHRLAEPRLRASFAEHLAKNLLKLVAGLEPESSPVEITDGQHTWPLIVVPEQPAWATPTGLALEVAKEPRVPLYGNGFMIGESGPDGVRLHRVARRRHDEALAVMGTVAIDPSTIAEAEERERAQLALEAAVKRAERESISRSRPALTTD